ncbi:MAG: cobalamin B12-binding domain-containing protein [Deltaproteobacteria bacterium]|nr:cobalamin B12-binding domain-containing protein [Deltaproteobacteria bacterium]
MERKIRVVVAKPGLDGHDRGAKVVARALRDAGMEVIYTGLRQTPEAIFQTCVQEDADALCLSSLSGAHDYLFPRVATLFKEKHVEDVLILGGGIIPEEDIPSLKEAGVAEIFGPGTRTDDIVNYIRGHLRK